MSSLAIWLVSAGLATLCASAAGPLAERVTLKGRARRGAARLSRTPVRSAASGSLVRIVGRVEYAEEPLTAPFSARSCAHYEAAVELPRRTGGFRRTIAESQSRPFYVADESGRALIDTSRALVDVVIDHYWFATDLDAEKRFELEQFLYRNGSFGLSHLHDAKQLRYVEGAIEPGEIVSVVGVAAYERASEMGTGYRDSTRNLVLEAPSKGHLYVSDGLHFS